jgi:hypothetical protein
MHPLISIEELEKLTEPELLCLEARLRDLILTRDLPEADLLRCLASLSNAVYVLAMRGAEAPFSGIASTASPPRSGGA